MKPQKQVSDIPNIADRHLWQIQPLRDAAWLIVALLLVWLGYAMRSVTVPLLVALLLAYLFEPVVSLMQRRLRFPRALAVGTVLGFGGLVILVVLGFTVPLVVGQTVSFVDAVRKGKYNGAVRHVVAWAPERVQPELNTFVNRAESWVGIRTEAGGATASDETPADAKTGESDSATTGTTSGSDTEVTHVAGARPGEKSVGDDGVSTTDDSHIRSIVQDELARHGALGQAATADAEARIGDLNWFEIASKGMQRVWSVVLGVVEIGLLTFLIPFYFFAFSVAWPRVIKFGESMIVQSHRERTMFLFGEMDKAVSGFVRGRIVICAILAVLYSVGWSIAGVPYAIPLGIIIGVFSLVPYLGGIGLPLSIGLLAADQFSVPDAERMAWWAIILWPGIIFLVCQFLDDYVLTPLIAGKATNLDPVSIVVAILAGGALAGLYGMLIAIPVAACIKILLREVFMPRVRDWIEGRVDDPIPIEE